jgi:hypothetical protein
MSTIQKVLSKKIVTLDELYTLTNEEYEICCSILYKRFGDDRFNLKENKYRKILHNIASVNELDYLKKYPSYYQYLIFFFGLMKISKEEQYNFIKEYPVNEYINEYTKMFYIFQFCNKLEDIVYKPLFHIIKIIGERMDARLIDNYEDIIKLSYTYRQNVAFGINENAALLFCKSKIIYRARCNYKLNINTVSKVLKKNIKLIDDELVGFIKRIIFIRRYATKYEITRNHNYIDKIFDIQFNQFSKDKNSIILTDLIIICQKYKKYSHHLEKLLVENKKELIDIQLMQHQSTYVLPSIKLLVSKSNTILSDKTKEMIEDIFFSDIHNEKINKNLDDVLIKYAA